MKNIHKVPKKQWRKWDIVGRGVFNEVYETLSLNPGFIRHPKDKPVSARFNYTLAWNTAWIAADAVKSTLKAIANGD